MNSELEQAITRVVPQMQGWCTVEKALAMAQLIEDTKPNVIVELGVFGGRSLIPQALALQAQQSSPVSPARIYGIDPWKKDACLEGTNDKANDEWWAKLDLEAIHRGCMEVIWHYNLDRHCTVIRAAGEHVAELFPDFDGAESIDILHIDGNHSELASTRDVGLWLPRVASGGYIWLDDTDWATTQKAVEMVSEQCDLVKDFGKFRLYRKR